MRTAARFLLVSTLFFQIACSSQAGFSPRVEKFGPCHPLPCLSVEVGSPPQLGDDLDPKVTGIVREFVAKKLRSGPALNVPDESDVDMVSEVIENFQAELPSGALGSVDWMFKSYAEVLFKSEDVVTISVKKEGYLGGAHGFTDRQLFVFSLLDGSRLSLLDFVSPHSHSVLSSVAEVELRKVRNIPIATSLREAGFDVPAGAPLPIPENFGVIKEGLLFRWNEYEIAPFALGPTEIIIPREACDSLVRTDAHLAKKVFPAREERPHEESELVGSAADTVREGIERSPTALPSEL